MIVDRLTAQSGVASKLADTTRFRHIANGYSDKGWIVLVQRRFDTGDLLFRRLKVIGDARSAKFERHCHASFAILLARAMSLRVRMTSVNEDIDGSDASPRDSSAKAARTGLLCRRAPRK